MSELATKVYYCPVEVALDRVGGKWKPLILWHLKEQGTLRNGQLRTLIPPITQKMLTQQVRQLEADGLIARTAYPDTVPRVEYALTALGRELEAMLDGLCAWGDAFAYRAGLEIIPPAGCVRPVPAE